MFCRDVVVEGHSICPVGFAANLVYDRIYIVYKADDVTGRIELGFQAVLTAMPVEAKIQAAQKQKRLPKGAILDVLDAAIGKSIISKNEAELIMSAEKARFAVISVDDFSPEQLIGAGVK